MNFVQRIEATQKTVDAFKGKPFTEGRYDCVQLVVTHARNMGVRIRVADYGDNASAAAALREMGFRTLGEAMDHHFTRIQPHEVLASDFVEVPGGNGFSSLMVAVGNGRTLGFQEEIPHCDILQPVLISGVWRIV
jgi:hypothetical protein